jgi:microcystin-dependent protein
MQTGQGQGLSLRSLGEQSGVESITLLVSEIPFHTHTLKASINPADNKLPNPALVLGVSTEGLAYTSGNPPLTQMAFQGLSPAGGSLPHNNMQPYLTLNFCIAMQGIFPPRS